MARAGAPAPGAAFESGATAPFAVPRPKLNPKDDWGILNSLQAMQAAQDEAQRAAARRSKQAEMRAALDGQMKAAEAERERRAAEQAAWLLEQRKMADSWTAEETAQKQTKAERVLHDKKVLLAHREEAKARLATERQRTQQADVADVEKARAAVLEEKRAAEAARAAERERAKKVRDETLKMSAVREAARQEARKEDQRLMSDYEAREAALQQRRAAEIAKRKARLEQHGARFSGEGGAGKQQADAEAEMVRRMKVEQEQKNAADAARERRDLEKIAESKRLMARDNAQLIEEKNQRKARQQAADNKVLEEMRRRAEDARRADSAEGHRKEDVRHQLAQELKATIAEHEQDGYSAHKMKTAAPKQQMTHVEKQINRQLLGVAQQVLNLG